MPYAGGAIYLVSPFGGPERRLLDFPAGGGSRGRRTAAGWQQRRPRLDERRRRVASTSISVATGERRAVTSPKPRAFDVCPALSPDGRALAYATCKGGDAGVAVCNIHVGPSAPSSARERSARLARQAGWIQGVAGRVTAARSCTASTRYRTHTCGGCPPTEGRRRNVWSWPVGAALAVDGPWPGPSGVHPEPLGRRRLAVRLG